MNHENRIYEAESGNKGNLRDSLLNEDEQKRVKFENVSFLLKINGKTIVPANKVDSEFKSELGKNRAYYFYGKKQILFTDALGNVLHTDVNPEEVRTLAGLDFWKIKEKIESELREDGYEITEDSKFSGIILHIIDEQKRAEK